jgi:hypothetical protein
MLAASVHPHARIGLHEAVYRASTLDVCDLSADILAERSCGDTQTFISRTPSELPTGGRSKRNINAPSSVQQAMNCEIFSQ